MTTTDITILMICICICMFSAIIRTHMICDNEDRDRAEKSAPLFYLDIYEYHRYPQADREGEAGWYSFWPPRIQL